MVFSSRMRGAASAVFAVAMLTLACCWPAQADSFPAAQLTIVDYRPVSKSPGPASVSAKPVYDYVYAVRVEAVEQDVPSRVGSVSMSCMVVPCHDTVPGENYVSTRFQPSGLCLPINLKIVAQPPLGRQLTVWWNANDPDVVVMKKDQAFEGVWVACLLSVMILLHNGAFVEQARRLAAGWMPDGAAA